MKQLSFIAFAIVLFFRGYSQKIKITWGDEFKLKKKSTDLQVINADNTGIYVEETHAYRGFFDAGSPERESATLVKLDKNLAPVYDIDFNKELKGKDFEQFFFIKDKAYLLATEYIRSEKRMQLYAAEIDKNTGELFGNWKEVTSWAKEEKKDIIKFRTTYSGDSSRMVLVSSVESKEHNNYAIRQFDHNLKAVGAETVLTNEFKKETYDLEDLVYTNVGNIVLVGRVFELEEGKKKSFRFINYNVRVYNKDGSQLNEINTSIEGKWLMSTRVAQVAGKDIVLAAFYSNERPGKVIKGMMVQIIDANTGQVMSTADQPIDYSLLAATLPKEVAEDDDDVAAKREKAALAKLQNSSAGFSKFLRFRNFIYTADKGLVILAEEYNSYLREMTDYRGGMGVSAQASGTETSTYRIYECGNIVMSKINASGKIAWLNVLPKQQIERIKIGSTFQSGAMGKGLNFDRFLDLDVNAPFYAGFGILQNDSSIHLIINDHPSNDKVLQAGQSYKGIGSFRGSNCFDITLNTRTGKCSRTLLFYNEGNPVVMPRLGFVMRQDMYLVGKEDPLFGKAKIAVARLTMKN